MQIMIASLFMHWVHIYVTETNQSIQYANYDCFFIYALGAYIRNGNQPVNSFFIYALGAYIRNGNQPVNNI